ncbi:hypothetical protein ACW5WN_01345 [Aeromonas lacus]
METFKLTTAAKNVLKDRTIYCVRNPIALQMYFGKENLQLIEVPPKTLLNELSRNGIDYVPSFYVVDNKAAYVIDSVSSIMIKGLVSCFSGSTLFTYVEELQTNIYAREVVQVEDKFYVVILSDPLLVRAEPVTLKDKRFYVPSVYALLEATKDELTAAGIQHMDSNVKPVCTWEAKRAVLLDHGSKLKRSV